MAFSTATRALLLRALERQGPMTAAELITELGLTYSGVYKQLAALKKADQVYIQAWLTTTGQSGWPERVWAVGYMKDAPRPRPKTNTERGREFQRRQRLRQAPTRWIQP